MEEQKIVKHSIYGILSFVLSVVDIFGLFVLFIVMGALEIAIQGGIGANFQLSNAISLFYFSTIILALAAVIFGVFGVFQKETKKFYGILGISLSLATFFIAFFILIGELFFKDKFMMFPSL
ncbi:MAG: hypothetical protein LBG21_07250 [Campylobacteraceae bacterium]|jgi:heme/copper-type cytochrome/quinol oxidase subunit 3|nr:hypothetical protein [Campylobacteraceae bacterium]